MDALRGFALLLGVVFHAAESFCPERYSWAVVDVNAHWFFDWFQHFCHTFRMELFFLIAGFFAHLLYHKKGAITFIRNRLARIVLPFLVGWFLLYPAFIFIWMWGASVGGRLDAMGVPEAYQTLPVWKITLGSITRLSFLKAHFNLLHLWFLHHLILLYTVTLASRCLFRVILCQDHYDALTAIIDSCYRKCIQSNWLGWLVPIATVPMLLLMKGWGVDTANEQLFYLPTLLLYGFCFLLGWLLHRQPELVTFLAGKKRWWIALIAGFLLCILSYNFGRIYRWVVPDAMPNLYNRGAYLLHLRQCHVVHDRRSHRCIPNLGEQKKCFLALHCGLVLFHLSCPSPGRGIHPDCGLTMGSSSRL